MSVIEPVFFSWKERILDIMIGVDQFEFGYSRIVEIRKKTIAIRDYSQIIEISFFHEKQSCFFYFDLFHRE